MLLKQSHSLCSSMTMEQERHEAAYMEALRSTVIKITYMVVRWKGAYHLLRLMTRSTNF